MKPVVQKGKSSAVIFDASLMETPEISFFTADHWRAKDALVGEAVGRGSAWFIDAPFGPVVLRQFLRGGLVAKLSRQHYFYSAVERSRPFREFKVLMTLHEQGLPVPKPVAALCQHRGFWSTGALITSRIESAHTLADCLGASTEASALWHQIGKCIRRFHNAGVWHADLNARNIMLDEQQRVFLIDFDRARFTPDKKVDGEGNLNRLKRSLTKFWPTSETDKMQAAWVLLEAGYHD
jgi:3-deoxy-D-manno-octulosonic acid kinase